MKSHVGAMNNLTCPRCDGDGKAHGSDRPFEWSGPGSYPGLCPECGGSGRIDLPELTPEEARCLDGIPADAVDHWMKGEIWDGERWKTKMKIIADRPTPEMYATCADIDCQCGRCGSSCDYTRCDCEDGFDGHEYVICDTCNGAGGWNNCMSSPEWCKANPLPGRESVERGAIEWFTFNE